MATHICKLFPRLIRIPPHNKEKAAEIDALVSFLGQQQRRALYDDLHPSSDLWFPVTIVGLTELHRPECGIFGREHAYTLPGIEPLSKSFLDHAHDVSDLGPELCAQALDKFMRPVAQQIQDYSDQMLEPLSYDVASKWVEHALMQAAQECGMDPSTWDNGP